MFSAAARPAAVDEVPGLPGILLKIVELHSQFLVDDQMPILSHNSFHRTLHGSRYYHMRSINIILSPELLIRNFGKHWGPMVRIAPSKQPQLRQRAIREVALDQADESLGGQAPRELGLGHPLVRPGLA